MNVAYLDLEGLKRVGARLNTLFLRKDQVANNLTATEEGLILDARQGKILLDAINGKVAKTTATATLSADGWSASGDSYVQTVTVSGMTSATTAIVVAAPASYTVYAENMVYCSAQNADTLTFTAATQPASSLTANILMLK